MKYARGLAACLTLALAACGNKPAPLTQQERQTVSETTANLKTRCVGRYLIELPADAPASGYPKIQGVDFDVKAISQDEYGQEIARREAELKAIKSIDEYPVLYAADEAWGKGTRYFIHRGTVHDDPGNRIIEAYKWDRGYRIKMQIEGWDYTNPDQTNDPVVKHITVTNSVPEKTRLVFGLLEKVRGRTEDDIPTEPGLCFPGGFLPGKAASNELVNEYFALPNKPDVIFQVWSDTGFQGNTSLLQRGQQALAVITEVGGKVIRKGPVDLPGMKAEELLIAGPTVVELHGHTFSLEVNSTTSGPHTPFLSLDMINGGAKYDENDRKIEKASLTEGEAIALWDAVSRTLRIRPNGL
jgi:Tle cognate immunity protein 4 C-terminal domain/Tle cognate immunity protein 4 N-terminal domain